MWVIRAVPVSSVFMMLFCSSEGGPQSGTSVSDLPDDNNEFLKLLGADDIPLVCSGKKKCVPFHKCCDVSSTTTTTTPIPAFDFDVYRTFDNVDTQNDVYHTINIVDHKKNSPCDDLLSICCETTCKENTTIPPDMRHVPSGQCGASNTITLRSFIITGIDFDDNQAQYGEFPWMVAVLDKVNAYIGGGSLVHHRIVLTAAHKVHDKKIDNLVARIGDWDLSSGTEPVQFQKLNVEKIVVHPDFQRRTLENNIALLILQKDVEYTDTVMPVCLPQPGQAFDGANCFVTGWGKDAFGETGRYQSIMKKKALPVVSNSACERMLQKTRLGSNFRLPSNFTCAGGGAENACTGDGGSPLVCPDPNNPSIYIQVGIVSWGIGCGEDGSPTVFASVPKTVNWINEIIEIEGGFDAIEFGLRNKSEQ